MIGNNVFHLCPQAVMESFEDGALLLRLKDRHLFELNPTAHYILAQTDGQHNAPQIATILAEAFQIPEVDALQDILLLYELLSAQGIIEMAESHHRVSEESRAMKEISGKPLRYIRNLDVVLREEAPDEGGLLFNPDTNQVRVLNTTGLFVWQQCDGTRDLAGIVAAVQAAFEEAPANQVAEDVQEFVKEMVESGFIGTSEALS